MNRFAAHSFEAFAVAAIALPGATVAAAPAPDGAPRTIDAMVAEADLVFRGRIVNMEYVLSEPSGPENKGIPYTFVTYEVHDLFHGEAAERVTLRFLGGYSPRNGLYMDTCVTPRFDLGDEDILFVKGNTEEFCPLVGETDGRLRIIDGQVYTENGHAVELGGEGALQFGARHLLEDVMTQDVMGTVIVMNLGPEAIAGPSAAMQADDLAGEITHAAALRPSPTHAFVDADAGIPFDGPDMTPAAPPAARLAPGETVSNPPSNEGFRPAKRR